MTFPYRPAAPLKDDQGLAFAVARHQATRGKELDALDVHRAGKHLIPGRRVPDADLLGTRHHGRDVPPAIVDQHLPDIREVPAELDSPGRPGLVEVPEDDEGVAVVIDQHEAAIA